jgi:hypothetical protein
MICQDWIRFLWKGGEPFFPGSLSQSLVKTDEKEFFREGFPNQNGRGQMDGIKSSEGMAGNNPEDDLI